MAPTVTLGSVQCQVSQPVVFGVEGSCLMIAGVFRIPRGGALLGGSDVKHVVDAARRSFEIGSLDHVMGLASDWERAAGLAMVYGGLILYSRCGARTAVSRIYHHRVTIDLVSSVRGHDRWEGNDRVLIEAWSLFSSGMAEEGLERLYGPLHLPRGFEARRGGGYVLSSMGFECFPPYVEV